MDWIIKLRLAATISIFITMQAQAFQVDYNNVSNNIEDRRLDNPMIDAFFEPVQKVINIGKAAQAHNAAFSCSNLKAVSENLIALGKKLENGHNKRTLTLDNGDDQLRDDYSTAVADAEDVKKQLTSTTKLLSVGLPCYYLSKKIIDQLNRLSSFYGMAIFSIKDIKKNQSREGIILTEHPTITSGDTIR